VSALGLFQRLPSASQQSSLHNKPLPKFRKKMHEYFQTVVVANVSCVLSRWQSSHVIGQDGLKTQIGTNSFLVTGQAEHRGKVFPNYCR
jgi:hypothetical protein